MTKHIQRQLSLLEFILSTPDSTATSICRNLDCTPRTFAGDVVAVNNLISPVSIIRNNRGHYSLDFPDNCNLEYVYSCFLKSSLEFQILTRIILQENYNYSSLAEDFFISESTIRRTIKRMNKILEKNGFSISPPPFSLIGDEKKILNFSIHLLQETFLDSKQILNTEEYTFLNDLYEWLKPLISEKINYPINERFNFYIYANILRIKQNFFIKDLDEISESNLIFSEKQYQKLYQLFKLDSFTKIYSQATFIFLNPFYAKDFQTLTIKQKESKKIDESVNMINNIISSLCSFFDIPSEIDQSDLILRLYNFTTLTYGNNYIIFDKYHFFVEAAYKRHPFIKKILHEVLQPYVSYTTYDKMAESIYIILTNMKGLTEALYRFQPKLKVLLLFDTEISHLKLMKQELEFLLPSMLDVQLPIFMDLKTLSSKKVDCDVILTNNPFLKLKEIPSYCFSIYPTAADIKKLTEFYSDWLNEKFYSNSDFI